MSSDDNHDRHAYDNISSLTIAQCYEDIATMELVTITRSQIGCLCNSLSQKIGTVNLVTPQSRPHKYSEEVNNGLDYSSGSKVGHYTRKSKLHKDRCFRPTIIGFQPR